MNKRNKNHSNPVRNIVLTCLVLFTGVGCQKSAENIAQAIPRPNIPAEESKPTESTQVDFKVWDELLGHYQLVELNGQKVSPRDCEVKATSSRVYDVSEKIYLDTVLFPLYSVVSSNYDLAYLFGPIKGKGISSRIEKDNLITYTYKFDGPVSIEGQNIELHLEMTVIKSDFNLFVSYTLSAPKFINETQSHLTLKKY